MSSLYCTHGIVGLKRVNQLVTVLVATRPGCGELPVIHDSHSWFRTHIHQAPSVMERDTKGQEDHGS